MNSKNTISYNLSFMWVDRLGRRTFNGPIECYSDKIAAELIEALERSYHNKSWMNTSDIDVQTRTWLGFRDQDNNKEILITSLSYSKVLTEYII